MRPGALPLDPGIQLGTTVSDSWATAVPLRRYVPPLSGACRLCDGGPAHRDMAC
jgi:hypothetical protein